MNKSLIAVSLVLIGMLLMWSAKTGVSPVVVVKDVLQGKKK